MALTLRINDIDVTAPEGAHVLDVARRNGFAIPSLCHHEAVEPIGACRICLVQVSQGGRTAISTSCNMLAEDGMQITTDSPLVRRHRAMNLELLLARAPASPQIRALAAEYGVVRPRVATMAESVLPNCILCELCNRTCARLGHHALNTVGRGDKKRIGLPFGRPSPDCVGCGSCTSVCPTRCITMKDTAQTRLIWGKTFTFVRCKICGGPVMTEEHRAYALAHAGLPEDYYDVCEPCKQADAARRFASVVW